jgi:hypothetical protein
MKAIKIPAAAGDRNRIFFAVLGVAVGIAVAVMTLMIVRVRW